ncbi:hypothetical protein ACQ4LF_23550, partial [Aeromonas salmonicida]
VREMLFYALHEGGGPALQALANRHNHVGPVSFPRGEAGPGTRRQALALSAAPAKTKPRIAGA